jgi:hypothetical protein
MINQGVEGIKEEMDYNIKIYKFISKEVEGIGFNSKALRILGLILI